jgi:hypothetical protein
MPPGANQKHEEFTHDSSDSKRVTAISTLIARPTCPLPPTRPWVLPTHILWPHILRTLLLHHAIIQTLLHIPIDFHIATQRLLADQLRLEDVVAIHLDVDVSWIRVLEVAQGDGEELQRAVVLDHDLQDLVGDVLCGCEMHGERFWERGCVGFFDWDCGVVDVCDESGLVMFGSNAMGRSFRLVLLCLKAECVATLVDIQLTLFGSTSWGFSRLWLFWCWIGRRGHFAR